MGNIPQFEVLVRHDAQVWALLARSGVLDLIPHLRFLGGPLFISDVRDATVEVLMGFNTL